MWIYYKKKNKTKTNVRTELTNLVEETIDWSSQTAATMMKENHQENPKESQTCPRESERTRNETR